MKTVVVAMHYGNNDMKPIDWAWLSRMMPETPKKKPAPTANT